MTLYIKNMACLRCQSAVKTELEKLGFDRTVVNPGEVRISSGISQSKREQLNSALKKSGFELMNPQKASLVKKIKNIIDELIYYSDEQVKKNLPVYLSKRLKYDYNYLVSLFYEVYNTTVEKYFMFAKIEKAKGTTLLSLLADLLIIHLLPKF